MNFYMTFKRCLTGSAYAKILLKLKLTLIILMTVILQVSATGYAQITLKEKGAPLEQIIQKIRKQTGYDFFYNAAMLSRANRVTLDVNNASVREVLDICFKNQPLRYRIEENAIVIQSLPNRETLEKAPILISGKVLDETGKPIPGASIRIKGSDGRAIAAGIDGTFKIVVNVETDVLVISYVGYKTQEIKLKAGQNSITINMILEENQMDEVVISTGIFKKADKSFTGASTTVTAKELQQFGNRSIITSLRNIDPSFNIIESNLFGSDPNRLPEITLRGNSSIPNVNETRDETRVGLNTPLIILDGFQSTLQKMLDINENEVESITILKDAAATAIYGSRGSNGVVVITTRAPKAGKLRLSFKSDLNLESPDLTDYSLLKSREKLELELKAGYFNNARAESDLPLKRYYNFLLNEVNSGVETDWMALPLRTGIGQRHNLRIEGGDQAFRYSASAQLNDIQGAMKGSSRKTFNGGITLAYTYQNVRFRNNLQIQQGKAVQSPYGTFSDYVVMNPYWRPYDANGNATKVVGDPGNLDYTGYWNTGLPTNPLYNAGLNTFDYSATSEIVNNSSVEWTLFKDLVLRAQLGLTKGNVQRDAFRPADHTFFNNYSAEDVFRKGDYRYDIDNYLNYDGSINLAYSRTFNKDHVLFAGLDYNVRQNKRSIYSIQAEGFPNANFDFISTALQYTKDGKPTGTEELSRAIGLTSNVNYSYKSRYFVDVSLRVDGSSQFGNSKRFAPFWSTGLGWNIHNEKFFEENEIVNRLKLRGSAGITGSQNFNAYQALSTYSYYTDQRYFNWMGAYLKGLGNTDLQWQQAMKYNIGTDAEFFNRRVRLTADYYVETTNDLVSSVNLPASSGFAYYTDNIGKLRNKGYEIKVTGFLMTNPDKISWSVTGALLHNKNKVLETSQALKDAQTKTLGGNLVEPGILYMEGYSSNDIWVVPSLGIDPSTGKELYLGKDGQPTYTWSANNVAAVGSTDPKIFGNFSTMLRYKNFVVNASFSYRFGGQQYNTTLIRKVETNSYKYNVDSRVYEQRWQKPGDVTAFKGLLVTAPTYKTSRFVQDENTLRFQNINFQYDLRSKETLRKLGLEALNFSANVADVFHLSTIRVERGTSYPFAKQFSININATF